MKEYITEKEILHDIKVGRERMPRESKESYLRWAIPCTIIGVILGIAAFFIPEVYIAVGIVCCLCLLLVILWLPLRYLGKRLRKPPALDEYEMLTVTRVRAEEEHYVQGRGPHFTSIQVSRYTFFFDGGRSWLAPTDNYTWSTECRMAPSAILRCTEDGDRFLAVIHKKTGQIAVAYPTQYFVYRPKNKAG